LPHASQSLATPGQLILRGTAGKDVFNLERDAARPWLLDVFEYLDGEAKPDNPLISVSFAALESISIDGLGDDDTIVIDASNGAIAVPRGITLAGGGGTNTLSLLANADTVTGNSGVKAGGTPDSGSDLIVVEDAFGNTLTQRVKWTGIQNPIDGVTAAQTMKALGKGFNHAAEALKDLLNDGFRSARR
jgi:hypothetical protein